MADTAIMASHTRRRSPVSASATLLRAAQRDAVPLLPPAFSIHDPECLAVQKIAVKNKYESKVIATH
jgi:hypothetical protein